MSFAMVENLIVRHDEFIVVSFFVIEAGKTLIVIPKQLKIEGKYSLLSLKYSMNGRNVDCLRLKFQCLR